MEWRSLGVMEKPRQRSNNTPILQFPNTPFRAWSLQAVLPRLEFLTKEARRLLNITFHQTLVQASVVAADPVCHSLASNARWGRWRRRDWGAKTPQRVKPTRWTYGIDRSFRETVAETGRSRFHRSSDNQAVVVRSARFASGDRPQAALLTLEQQCPAQFDFPTEGAFHSRTVGM